MTEVAFRLVGAPLPGLAVLERERHADARGEFRRLFSDAELSALGWPGPVAQVNHSVTLGAGTARGIHFQYPPHTDDKLVTCVAGSVWDLAVDLRSKSPSFLRWHGEVLSAGNARSVLIPKGFGHGFVALSDMAALVYVHSAPYAPQAEGGLHPQDPALGIDWPVPLRELSAKDAGRAFIDATFVGISP